MILLGYGEVQEEPQPLKLPHPAQKIKFDHISLTMAEIMEQIDEARVLADCPEGCIVEADGTCPHGHESAALKLGLI